MSGNAESSPTPANAVEIRHCDTLAEFHQCVEIERTIWGEQIIVPAAIFVVAQHTGGQILGAFDGDTLVGFTVALVGNHDGKPFLHSHMTGVLRAYQNQGVGRRLKLFQRQEALKREISLIEWTFDPLETRNAHFNLVRLGAVSAASSPTVTESPKAELHAGLPTDRLIAEWWLDSAARQGMPSTGKTNRRPPITEPSACPQICLRSKPTTASAAAIDARPRSAMNFRHLFREGYVATGLHRRADTVEYILQPAASIAGLRLPEYRPEEFED